MSVVRFENRNDYNNIKENINNRDQNIYRYKFLDSFTSELFKFSKIHQYDHRKDFKEAWKIWIEDNDDIVNEEIRRLKYIGYEGDIMDKMFKSARYYFRKKNIEKKIPKERRLYIGVHKELLDGMDEHISSRIYSGDYKPSNCFNEFCNNNVELLKEEIHFLCKNGYNDVIQIKNKIKKTYKNRYFLIINKNDIS